MFLRLFRSSSPALILILPILILALWFPALFNAQVHIFHFDNYPGLFFNSLEKISIDYPAISKIAAFISYLLIAFLLVWLNTKFFFITARSQMSALIYLLIISSIVTLQRFTPVLVASIFLIVIINRLFASYKYDGLAIHYFDAAFLVSLSSLFYIYSLYFMMFIWVGLLIFRTFRWREWLFTILGLTLPYLFIFTYYFMISRNLHNEFQNLWISFTGEKTVVNFSLEFKIFTAFTMLLVLISSAFMIRSFDTKKIQSRKYFLFYLWTFILSLLVYFIIPSLGIEIFCIIAISLAYLISHYFIFARNNWINNLLFIFFILGVFLVVYFKPVLERI